MSRPVEVLVASGALARVRRELRSLEGVSVRSTPSAGASITRLLVATVEDLAAGPRLCHVEHLLRQVDQRSLGARLPMVLSAAGQPDDRVLSAVQVLAQVCGAILARRRSLEAYVAPDVAALRRLASARLHNAEDQLMASAKLFGRELLVWSCEPALYRVSVDDIPALAAMDEQSLGAFSISPSGSRIHWQGADVDLSLATIRERVDPAFRARNEHRARREAAGYGQAIRTLRLQVGLTQDAIPGLSDREVRRLERGGIVPRAETVRLLAAAHKMEAAQYLQALGRLTSSAGPRRLA